jgi:hypothetical protein
MCHSYDARRRTRTAEEDPEEPEEPDDEPSFLDEERADAVELLTDGGDD